MEFLQPDTLVSAIVFLLIGSLMLYFGADGLVRGSVGIALRTGISPLVIGLTVVAFGTSSPELLVSMSAGLDGNSEIAVGNVIGSNICNIALIVGAAALVKPIHLSVKTIKVDFGIMIAISLAMIGIVIDGIINHVEGIILASGILVYVVLKIWMSRKKNLKETEDIPEEVAEEMHRKPRPMWKDILLTVGGLIVLIIGGTAFLDGAIFTAEYIGVSKAVIGLSIVAFGTSLPELATSVVAALKSESDISIGNAIGSNIFNILLVLGLTSAVFKINSSGIDYIDLAVMIFLAIIIVPLSKIGNKLSRIDGAFLLLIYFAYIYYLYSKEVGL